MLMLAGGVSLTLVHPLFCLLIVLAVVHAFACRTPRAAPPVPKCGKPVTKALRNVNVKRRSPPKVAYDLDERVASQLMCRQKTPDWSTYYTRARDSLQRQMEEEFEASGNRDPHIFPPDRKACRLDEQ